MPLITSIWHGQGWVAKAQGGPVMIRSMDYNRYKDERKLGRFWFWRNSSNILPRRLSRFPWSSTSCLASIFIVGAIGHSGGENGNAVIRPNDNDTEAHKTNSNKKPLTAEYIFFNFYYYLVITTPLWPALFLLPIHPSLVYNMLLTTTRDSCKKVSWKIRWTVRSFDMAEPFFCCPCKQPTVARYSPTSGTYSWAGKSSSQVTPPLLNHCSLMSLNDTGKLSYVSMGGVVTVQALAQQMGTSRRSRF